MAGFAAIAEHHHFFGNDLHGGMLDAFFIFPATGLETAFDINLLAFDQILFANLSQVTPGDDIEPLGFGMTFAVDGIPGAAGGDGEGGYGATGGRVTHFRVASQVTNDHDFIQSTAHIMLLTEW